MLDAAGIQEQPSYRNNESPRQGAPAMRIPAARYQRTNLKIEERTEEINSSHNNAQDERCVAVDPDNEHDRKPVEPSRISSASGVNQYQLRNQQNIRHHLRPNGKADCCKEPQDQGPGESHLGISRIEPTQAILGYQQQRGHRTEPEHQPGVTAAHRSEEHTSEL